MMTAPRVHRRTYLVAREQARERAHMRGGFGAPARALAAPALLVHVRGAARQALQVCRARPAGHLGRAHVTLCGAALPQFSTEAL